MKEIGSNSLNDRVSQSGDLSGINLFARSNWHLCITEELEMIQIDILESSMLHFYLINILIRANARQIGKQTHYRSYERFAHRDSQNQLTS